MKRVFLVFICAAVAPWTIAEPARLLQVPTSQLSPAARKKIAECEDDIRAAISFETYKKLPHAKLGVPAIDEEGRPAKDESGLPILMTVFGDGGTAHWQGDGYTIIVWHRYATVGGIAGVLFGPEVTLGPELSRGSKPVVISFVRFVAPDSPAEKTTSFRFEVRQK